jgi:hypothetical protein
VQGEVVALDWRDVSRVDFKQLARRAADVQSIENQEAAGTPRAEAKREEEFAHTRADIQKADVFGQGVVRFQVLHERAAEAVVAEKSIAAAEDERWLATKLGKFVLVWLPYRRLPFVLSKV